MKLSTRRTVLRSLLAASVTGILTTTPAYAFVGGCVHCGCAAHQCRKICRLVKDEKKIITTCWGMECEDVCIPGPSTPDCKHCETVCSKGPDDRKICTQPKRLVWTSWIPSCGPDIFTKRKLMKKTVTKTVPSFKWIVEDACAKCVASMQSQPLPEGSEIPPVPQGPDIVVVAGFFER